MKKVKQIWKPVYGFEEEYNVSNFGHIYSKISKKQIKQSMDKYGYMVIQLTCKRRGIKRKAMKVHRVVFEAFIRPLLPDEDINHIDEDRRNNNIKNLVAMNRCEHRRMHHLNKPRSKQTKKKIGEGRKRAWQRKFEQLDRLGLPHRKKSYYKPRPKKPHPPTKKDPVTGRFISQN